MKEVIKEKEKLSPKKDMEVSKMENQKVKWDEIVWTEIEQPDTWKPTEKGDSIAGVLIAKKENVGENKSKLYTLETQEDGVKSVWGSAVLDMRMELAKVGEFITIEFKGREDSSKGKQPTKIFKVSRGAVPA